MEDFVRVLKVREDMEGISIEFVTNANVRVRQWVEVVMEDGNTLRMPITKIESSAGALNVTAGFTCQGGFVSDIRDLLMRLVRLVEG